MTSPKGGLGMMLSQTMASMIEKIAFLETVIPEMFWMTSKAKRKIAAAFKERVFQ